MFKALSSETRREMLKSLIREEKHITGLAKELGISVPVAAKHIKILESAGLVERRKFGRSHIMRAKTERMHSALEFLGETFDINIQKGASVLDVLKEISGVTVESIGDKEYVTSVDGEEGYYIYEVNGKPPNTSINKFTVKNDTKVELKKLVPVKKKEIRIKVA
ncbi:MAG: metalloregulator ArsR/SmtB family transcription factor [Candidatus Hydrothermarchaeaceae archaeon]